MGIRLNTDYMRDFVSECDLERIAPEVLSAHRLLTEKTGAGSDFLGWLDLPKDYDREEFFRIKAAAKRIRADSDILVVIGIGGSYLGARAAIEFCRSQNHNLLALAEGTPQVFFSGNSFSSSALCELFSLCEKKNFSVNVISKSGTTAEPAVAFRIFRELLEKKYGKEAAAGRIYVTTDRSRGALRGLSERAGYETFVIPDDVGGRYSVLTAVGLLPIAVSGCDIDELMRGADDARKACCEPDLHKNGCYKYAALRNLLYRKGRAVELMVAYEPDYAMMNEWYKQLFGESEGKDGKGLFPASAIFTTDLHSLGQYIQQGRRLLFETAVMFDSPRRGVTLGAEASDADGLNYLAGKTMDYVNRRAFEGTVLAHADGGVPCIILELPRMDEYSFGFLVYFLERACAISGYVLGVNPFDQPGVESYKKNMFALLGRPGFEAQRAGLEKRLSR